MGVVEIPRCPTCSKPFDGSSLPERILALLATRKYKPKQMATELGARREMVYQALRRLTDRDAVRRNGYGEYSLAPKEATPPTSLAALSAEESVAPVSVVRRLARDLRAAVETCQFDLNTTRSIAEWHDILGREVKLDIYRAIAENTPGLQIDDEDHVRSLRSPETTP